ncbi:MAG: hypothetical protein ACI4DY_05120 [Monoglobaceae bacterium]
MKARLAVVVCIILMTVTLWAPYTYAADNSVGIEIAFDKPEYVTGDTASVKITLTGIDDEKTDGVKLGAFETHLKFDTDKLEYKSCGFEDKLAEKLQATSSTSEFMVTTEHSDVIVSVFDSQSGIELTDEMVKDGTLVIGTVSFKVKASVGNEIETNFSSDYVNVVTMPFGTNSRGKELNCTAGSKTTAKIMAAAMDNPVAVFSNNTVSGTVGVRLSESESGILLAVLRNTSTGLVKKSKIQTVDSSKTYDVSFDGVTDTSDLRIDYYLWNSFLNMHAIAENVSAEVTAGN